MGGHYLDYPLDTVQFIAKHIKHEKNLITNKPITRDKFINECLNEYHKIDDESRKKELRDAILINIWYLFPYVLSKYKLKGHIFDDTLQLMIVTTLKAIENYNPNLGFKFSSYISGYLKDAISTSLRNNMIVSCPTKIAKDQEILRLKTLLEDPIPKKNTSYTELNIDEDVTLTQIAKDIVNKNKPSGLIDQTAEDSLIKSEGVYYLHQAIEKPNLLTKKEKMVLILRFGLSGVPRLTLSQIASIFKQNGNRASKVWIFQIEQKAKAKIRRYFLRNNLI